MTRLATRDCTCQLKLYIGQERPSECVHGNPYLTMAQLKPKPRKPLSRVSEGKQKAGKRNGLKQGKGFAASKAQRDKVRDLRCIVTGLDRFETTIHPMHAWDRSRGGCDHPLCVVPGSAEIHRLYDEKKLDILPALVTNGYFAEMAHVIEAHEVSPTRLIERLTCSEWKPVAVTVSAHA